MHVAVVGTQDFHIDAAQALGEDLRSSSGMLPPAVVLSGARGVAARLNGGFVLVRASHAARRGSSRAEGLGETLLVYRKGEEGGRDGSTANPEEGVFLWRSEGTQIWHLSVSSSHPCADDPHLAVFKVTGGQAGTKGGEEGPGMPFGGEGVGTWWVWTGERFEEDPQTMTKTSKKISATLLPSFQAPQTQKEKSRPNGDLDGTNRGCLVAVAAVSSSALAEGEADSEHVHKSSGEAPLTDTRLPSLFGLLSSHKLKRTRTGLVHGQPYPVVEVFEESEKGQQPSLGLILRDPFSAPPSSFSPLNCEDSAVGDSAKSGGTFSVRSGDLCLLFDRVFACAPGEPRREGCQTNGLETEEGLRGERREHSSISSEPGRYGRRESVEAEVQRAAPFSVHVQSPAEDVGQRADGLGSSGGERGVDPIMRMPVSAVSTAVGGGPPSAVEAHSDHSVLGFVASRLPTSEAALQTAAGVPGEEAMKRAERLAEEAAEMCAQGVEVHFALSEKNSGHSVGSRSHSINMSEGGVTSRGLKSRTNLTVSSSVNGEELSRSFEKVLKAQDQRHGQKLGNLLEGERGRERARSRLLDQSLLQPSFEQVLEARRRLYQ
uniref:Uncharacterized protein n=1 Tax=Chromera velia CCMP2878 TaxID=1169474 RepID=A0A0G4HBY1_9ALVE|eukprot:Cvel_6275.t1-p1 / transcript=Cvel_6275.t1 / gene=Cvel_6275 / organism=Chromera_velia_CCMP2878 / gene_product=hypothetical protein / transcript_product=hypothetical protein / location=Cvel_scaffold304:75910-81311(+) / protein_length=602 / sequence_SO=supercontig / SO=protein_coding / is_pseudo=false